MLELINNSISLSTLIWLFPIIFILHDFEEIIMFECCIKKYKEKALIIIPQRFQKEFLEISSMNTAQFSIAVLLVFFVVIFATISSQLALSDGGSLLFLTTVIMVFFIHVFTHVGQSIVLKAYTPGVLTSIILVFPYSLYVLNRLVSSSIITLADLSISIPLSALAIPIILIFHNVGRKLI